MGPTRSVKIAESANTAFIPRATLSRMIAEVQPDVRCSKEARELFVACGTRFVHHVTTQALEICKLNKNKTIMPTHALAALDSVGFGEFREEAEAAMKECKVTAARRRRKANRLENLGIPLDVLQRQQQHLIDQARRSQEELYQRESEIVQQQGTPPVLIKQEWP